MSHTRSREIKRGDLAPNLRVQVTQIDPETRQTVPVDGTQALSIRVIGVMDGTIVFDRPPSTITADGWVEMLFQPGDTDEVGTIEVEVEYMWAGGKPQSVRTENTLVVKPDLG